mgnify:CR=1 FL=1
MHNVKQIARDTYYVGSSDRRLSLFENIYPIPRGVSYNSYLVKDEKTVLLDTADHSVSRQFMENILYLLDGRKLDYLIVNHMEPDHAYLIEDIVERFPDVRLVGNAKTLQMMKQFFTFDVDKHAYAVKEGDVLSSGSHSFSFVMAPMVHWPEVMVTYDSDEKILYSADAFGTFGALSGNIFADELDLDRDWLDDARRYYVNIVGKYGNMTMNLLKKASALDIRMICPLHGPIWRKDLEYFINKHRIWASYEAEKKGTAVIYSSIYGDTENAAAVLSSMLAERGVRDIRMHDASVTDPSYLLSECFKYSTAVFMSPTYNAEIFPKIQQLLTDLKEHAWQNRDVAIVESGSWALSAGRKMTEILGAMKDIRIAAPVASFKSSLKDEDLLSLTEIADRIAACVNN